MGSPKFMGLAGRPLSLAVSTVATTGFVLFGYGKSDLLHLYICDGECYMLTFVDD